MNLEFKDGKAKPDQKALAEICQGSEMIAQKDG